MKPVPTPGRESGVDRIPSIQFGTASCSPLEARWWVETDLGRFLIAASRKGLAYLTLQPEGALERLEAFGARRGGVGLPPEHGTSLVEESARQLIEFARGERRDFELPLDLGGTEFQRAAWRAMTEIPFGETRTYGELAQVLGRPGAMRAVGAAAGANPVAIVVPCHRVLARGGIGGFSGGMRNKRALLLHEGHRVQGHLW